MPKLRIEIDLNKCIGNGACVAADPAHFSVNDGKAVLSLQQKKGNMVFLEKEASLQEAHNCIEAGTVCPTNAIRVIDLEKNKDVVLTEIKIETAQKIPAQYDDSTEFVLDPNGYFLIRINHETKEIEAAFCGKKNTVELIVTGKKPIDIYHTIVKHNVISRMEHAAYLGRELQKAYIAVQKGITYVQDDELIL